MKKIKELLGDAAIRASSEEYLLSFEKFLRVHNNFRLHFTDNLFGDMYRRQAAYRKCKRAHKKHRHTRSNFCKLSLYLRVNVCNSSDRYYEMLYKAYVMMRPFAASNREMFK